MNTTKGQLAKKLLNVQRKIDGVKKSGVNDYAKYVYLTLSDVLEAVRKHLIEEGVLAITSIDNVEVTGDITNLKISCKLIDVDTGEEMVVFGSGSAKDTQGFGTAKAYTIGMKTMFEKLFLLPTYDDPESQHGNPSYSKGSSGGGSKSVEKVQAVAPAPASAPAKKPNLPFKKTFVKGAAVQAANNTNSTTDDEKRSFASKVLQID